MPRSSAVPWPAGSALPRKARRFLRDRYEAKEQAPGLKWNVSRTNAYLKTVCKMERTRRRSNVTYLGRDMRQRVARSTSKDLGQGSLDPVALSIVEGLNRARRWLTQVWLVPYGLADSAEIGSVKLNYSQCVGSKGPEIEVH